MAKRIYKYKEDFPDMLIEHMGNGYSFQAFAGVIKVSERVLYDWLDQIPEFNEAYEEAKARCRAKWEQFGIEGMFMGGKDNPFNATVWVFNMKNRFGWTDKREDKVETKTQIVIQESQAKALNKLLENE